MYILFYFLVVEPALPFRFSLKHHTHVYIFFEDFWANGWAGKGGRVCMYVCFWGAATSTYEFLPLESESKCVYLYIFFFFAPKLFCLCFDFFFVNFFTIFFVDCWECVCVYEYELGETAIFVVTGLPGLAFSHFHISPSAIFYYIPSCSVPPQWQPIPIRFLRSAILAAQHQQHPEAEAKILDGSIRAFRDSLRSGKGRRLISKQCRVASSWFWFSNARAPPEERKITASGKWAAGGGLHRWTERKALWNCYTVRIPGTHRRGTDRRRARENGR